MWTIFFGDKIHQESFFEDVTVSNDSYYKLWGGYDSGYATQKGLSSIIGPLTITTGTLEMQNLALSGQ